MFSYWSQRLNQRPPLCSDIPFLVRHGFCNALLPIGATKVSADLKDKTHTSQNSDASDFAQTSIVRNGSKHVCTHTACKALVRTMSLGPVSMRIPRQNSTLGPWVPISDFQKRSFFMRIPKRESHWDPSHPFGDYNIIKASLEGPILTFQENIVLGPLCQTEGVFLKSLSVGGFVGKLL